MKKKGRIVPNGAYKKRESIRAVHCACLGSEGRNLDISLLLAMGVFGSREWTCLSASTWDLQPVCALA